MQNKKLLFIAVTLCLLLAFTGSAAIAEFSDVSGHWAREQINKWADQGLAAGYGDGTFKPGSQISRAEFVAMVNRAFAIDKTGATNGFTDVKSDKWYYGDIAAAKAAGCIGGYKDGTFKPDQTITRQEVAGILVRLLQISPAAEGAAQFSDAAQIPAWAKSSVGAVAAAGLMRGMPDNTFQPLQGITRAEAIVALDRAMGNIPGTQPKPGKESEPAEQSAVEGIVTFKDKVLDKVEVRIFKAGSYEILKEAKTDSHGVFKVDLEAGKYDVTAVTGSAVAYATGVNVSENQVAGINLVLEDAAIVKGVLKDKNNRLVKGAVVLFTANPTFIAATNNSGEYTIAVAANKTYTVRAYESGKKDKAPGIVGGKLDIGPPGSQKIHDLNFPVAVGSGSGGGSGGGGTMQPETITVKDAGELTAAINKADNGDAIKLTDDIEGDIELNKLVNLCLNGKTLNGDVTINANAYGSLNIAEETNAGTITGCLKVNAPNATVNNWATVGGNLIIEDVAGNTWNERAKNNKLVANNKKAIVLNIIGGVASLEISGTGNIKVTLDQNAELAGAGIIIDSDGGEVIIKGEGAGLGNVNIIVNRPATIITPEPIRVTAAEGVEVTVKRDEQGEGKTETGTGEEMTLEPPVPAAFTPGAGGAIAFTPFAASEGKIGGLYIGKNSKYYDVIFGGNPIYHHYVELWFIPAVDLGASGYKLQYSEDDGETWDDYLNSDYEPLTTGGDTQDNFVVTDPYGETMYRLVVMGGDMDGCTSNEVTATIPKPGLETKFTGWSLYEGMDISGVMLPWVGRGLEAGFTARLSDYPSTAETVYENVYMDYQWYRVNPVSYETTAIRGATELEYITTEDDVGYSLLIRAEGDDENISGFAQIMSHHGIMIPNEAYISDVTETGFVLNLHKSVTGGIAPQDLKLIDYNGDDVTITGVSQGANAAIYNIAADLDPARGPFYLCNTSDFWKIATAHVGHEHGNMLMEGIEVSYSVARYSIDVELPVGGAASVGTTPNIQAAAGETITVDILNIEEGKQFKLITVKDEDNGVVSTTEVTYGEEYTFTMPASAVTVTVELEDV
ncbi:S-layer homology domain-containing protein [Desulfoscipio sp. XC116]|uniref:S-layer homology domain-containing protein n=1 Tax=Desulfoscipio sp. XC116 TaxID=3144975 RepID=UPI00325BADA2